MNRKDQMDDFLKHWAMIRGENIEVTKERLYSSLTNYGLTNEEQNISTEQYFSKWINDFKDNPNLNVYYTEHQPGFLQFSKGSSKKHVKLYLSLPEEYIDQGINKIFGFIAQNNLLTNSKVSRRLRSDGIILRMSNLEDAIKVINYVNNDKELTIHAKDTNPFMMKCGKVGIAYDNMLSYNATLTALMEQYLNDCYQNNNIYNVNIEDFTSFIHNKYQKIFSDPKELNNFISTQEFQKNANRLNGITPELITNYREVFEVMLLGLNGVDNINDFGTFYKDISNVEKNEYINNYHREMLDNIAKTNKESRLKNEELTIRNVDYENPNVLLEEYVRYAIYKYKDPNLVALYLKSYIESGNINTITRDNNLRKRFKLNVSPKIARNIVGDIKEYMNYYTQAKVPSRH